MSYGLLIVVFAIGLPVVWLKFRDQFGAALVVLFGVWLLADSFWTARDIKALATSGQVAQAEAVGDSYTQTTKMRSGSRTFKARIAFQTAGGQLFTEEATIPEAVLDKFKAGQKVGITYLPSKPAVYRFNPLPAPGSDDILFSLGIIVAGSLWLGYKRLTAGQPAEA